MGTLRWIAAGLAASLLFGALLVFTLHATGWGAHPLYPSGGWQSWRDATFIWLSHGIGAILIWCGIERLWPRLDRRRGFQVALFPLCVAAIGVGTAVATGADWNWLRSPSAAIPALAGLLAFSWVVLAARSFARPRRALAASDDSL